ncbi:MAG: translation initiation factor IF-2 subunit beta [Metallosphaera yellowstonensis]|jgi:translation initiation factor 2 subunit 2|uniref:Translation initiation factor 2 subunit beta n=1 Tax=Metallosphaera yellowstonensis MK1 TaxID=671065 RepID=H2C345_9CREN|nr:translation initiation factor IF-2 subunit beta [Metallosphaera yellowstonensis]EHP70666.1 translation initiation factor 2, beta subunit (eIF-2beta)/eIF-5 N-terminal domain [Metallosphaera yellowstonensis MK1]
MSENRKRYQALLERLYVKLPKKGGASETQTLPTLSIINVGNTTIIRNFGEYCDRIRREDKLCMRYLLKELAAAGSIGENGQLIIQGKFSSAIVNTFMDRFLKTYVQCSTCKSYDTVLVKEKKIWYIQCLACGAKTPVKPL